MRTHYPIRLKPRGPNRLETLRERGVNHIELRMIDLNPLRLEGIDVRDVKFAQLLLVWLAATPRQPITSKDQMQHIANFKNAAHYDLRTVKIVMPDNRGRSWTLAHNGTIFDFPHLDDFKEAQEGQTDSERVLYYFLDEINRAQDHLGRALTRARKTLTL